ncbi:MAG: glycosyltransferase family 4 protein [Anaerolineales bacterium]
MRVLYLSRGNNPHDRRFLRALADTEHVVTFLPLESTAARERDHVPKNVEVMDLGETSDDPVEGESEQLAMLSKIADRLSPDLVHAGPIQRGAYLAARLELHPLVSMSWGSDLLVEAQVGEGREKAEYTLQESDVLVCDCEAVREAAIVLGMPRERTVVFAWGVDLTRFSADGDSLREALGWQDAFVVLSARPFEESYGSNLIVEAFIEAAAREPSLRLLMLGDGSSLRTSLIGELEEAGVLDRVRAPGMVGQDQLPAYYRTADLYVSASHSDGSSISLLEAMASGRPALVSDIPGNKEWVRSGENGWLFSDGNAQELVTDLVKAARSRLELAEMGARARQTVEARGDWRRNFPKLLEAYQLAKSVPERQAG